MQGISGYAYQGIVLVAVVPQGWALEALATSLDARSRSDSCVCSKRNICLYPEISPFLSRTDVEGPKSTGDRERNGV